MASNYNNNNNNMHQSWKEDCYQKKGEEKGTDWTKELSAFDDFPSDYLLDADAFKDCIHQHQHKNFILVPPGADQVRCVHTCYILEGEAIGILG
jgi:hypothetical protein